MITALLVIGCSLCFGIIMLLGLFWNADKNYKSYRVDIKCPECGAVQEACVLRGFPWDIYVHHCKRCEYIIQKSEWEEVA
jgi:hypothetical protein